MFGLFHGVVFLPVVLSLFGPAPYVTKDSPTTADGKTTAMDEEESISFIQVRQPSGNKAMLLKTVEEEPKGSMMVVDRKLTSQNESDITEDVDLNGIVMHSINDSK